MYKIKRLAPNDRLKYKPLMFQWLYLQLEQSERSGQGQSRFLLIGAEMGDEPAGLAVLELREGAGAQHAILQCLFVAKPWRRKAIASSIMREVRSLCLEKQMASLEVYYYSGKSSTESIEAWLQKEGWTHPLCDAVVFHINRDIARAGWLRERPLPSGLELFLWADKKEQELKQSIEAAAAVFPDFLSPFKTFAPLEPSNSLGLRSEQGIKGWSMTYRLNEETILYDAVYISPEYQQIGLAFHMLARSICLQLEAGIPYGIFTVNRGTPVMMKLAQQWLAPYSWKTSEKRISYLPLK
ncbi:GNAT family N-acetyltransferase [Paenibacillus sp. Leaf72]|uniref:GNAT family N-acetyltransferase n=1 Tax=Paenibacillus sp. Leaf72 TaxID=1736234 RepID=UPI0012DC5128|nr:GNAT family N-acetyltransferase [Paenibacillus sp. Leaf72]